jgi:hypothetical protein
VRRALLALPPLLLVACGGDRLTEGTYGLTAFCQATVETAGGDVVVDVETDYLPHVVACENGAADQAALEAQAIAARSYLYYRLERTGSIGDGTGDQVYTCGRPPGEQHLAAARATSGLVLRYPPDAGDAATQVAAFYVAGALQDGPDCVGGTDDPTSTEVWVTYNQGKSGDEITQTELGFVDPANHANRGCMSQNGSHCLAEQGWDVRSILRFYYGEDIGIVQAEGACVEPLPGGPDAGPGGGPDAAGGGGGGIDGDATGGCAIGAASGMWLVALALALAPMPWGKRARRGRRRRGGRR